MTFDVAIPACLAADRLGKCLAALRHWGGVGRIVVSLDRAPDASREHEYAEDAQKCAEICSYYGAKLVRPERWGYMARNWNSAVENTASDNVIVMNDDVLVTRGWLRAINAVMSSPIVGAAGFSIFQSGDAWPHERRLYGFTNEVFDACWFPLVTGPCFVMRRWIWAEAGYFSEDTQMLESEVGEWCQRNELATVLMSNPPVAHEWNVAHREKGATVTEEVRQGGAKSKEAWRKRYGYEYERLGNAYFLRMRHLLFDKEWVRESWPNIDWSFERFEEIRW